MWLSRVNSRNRQDQPLLGIPDSTDKHLQDGRQDGMKSEIPMRRQKKTQSWRVNLEAKCQEGKRAEMCQKMIRSVFPSIHITIYERLTAE